MATSTVPVRVDENASASGRRWLVLAVMSVGTLIVFLDDTVVNTALPRLSVDLRASIGGLQWVVDAYVLVLAGLLLLCGSLGDRYGRKRVMTAGLVVFAGGVRGAALSNSLGSLIVMRCLQGLGAAAGAPGDAVHHHERVSSSRTRPGHRGVDRHRRDRSRSGPSPGGYLIDASGWSAVFWLQVPFTLAALVGMVIVPESRDDRHVGLDLPGARARHPRTHRVGVRDHPSG